MKIVRGKAMGLGIVAGAALLFGTAALAAETPPEPPDPPAPAPAPQPPPKAADPAPTTFLGYGWGELGRARYEIRVQEETQVQTPTGNSAQFRQSLAEIEIEPVGEEESLTWLAMRFQRATLTATPEGLQVDSASRENPLSGPLSPLPAVFDAIRGKSVRVLVTPGGRVRKVEGLEELLAAARSAMPEGPQRDYLLALVLPTDMAAVASKLANVVFYLPGVHVEPGYTKQEKWPSPTGTGEVDRTVELVGVVEHEGGKATQVRQVLSGEALPPLPVPAQKVVVQTRSYRNEAMVWMDPESRIALRLESTVKTEQTVRKEGADPASPPDMIVNATITIATRLLGREPKPAEKAAPQAPAEAGEPPPPQP